MSLINLFVAARTALRNRRQRRRALDELKGLDDRTLADIGIHRSQIPALAMSFEEAARIEAAPLTDIGAMLDRSGGLAHGHR